MIAEESTGRIDVNNVGWRGSFHLESICGSRSEALIKAVVSRMDSKSRAMLVDEVNRKRMLGNDRVVVQCCGASTSQRAGLRKEITERQTRFAWSE